MLFRKRRAKARARHVASMGPAQGSLARGEVTRSRQAVSRSSAADVEVDPRGRCWATHLFAKLGVSQRTAAVTEALRLGIICLDE